MKACPEYFGWSRDEQERYGVAIPGRDDDRLSQALLEELWGRKIRSPRAAARAASRLPLAEQDRWNEVVLPLRGIGDDCFFLNEGFAAGKSILDFPTLLAYDESDFRFQEEARRKDDPTYQGRIYRGSLYLTWARLFVGTQLIYATLSMAAGYILCALEEAASDLIQELVPHRYVPGKNHGKVEGECYRWDRRPDASGKETLLDELQHRTWAHTNERYENMLTAWDRRGKGCVYLVDVSEPSEKNIHFVFSDTRALGAVCFRSFLKDCGAIERPVAELNRALEQEKAEVVSFVRKEHDELERTFDPSVVRFRKRRKILVRKDAFDDIE
jgi:hypothetical protein